MPVMDNAFGLVVGIANYQYINKLPSVVLQDAQDIYDVLVDPRRCGYPKDHVELLLDNRATRNAVYDALSGLSQRSTPDSTLLIYMSCHGGRIESGPHAGEYLLTVDTVCNTSEGLSQTSISGDEFSRQVQAIHARKVVIILDCCHSAGLAHIKDRTAPTLKAGLSENYYDLLKVGRGRVIFAASRDTEFSYILPGAANSVFTQHLLAGLHGGIVSEDNVIRIFDLFEYIQPRVTCAQPNQHPIFKAEIEDNFPMALANGGQKGFHHEREKGFQYDAYLSYVENKTDSRWVWKKLVPLLEKEGLRVAVSGDVEAPGVARIVNVERGITRSKRTIVVLSDTYLANNWAEFENVLALTLGIQEGSYRLLPVMITPVKDLPMRLSMLTVLDFSNPRRVDRESQRLIQALRDPLPLKSD